MNLVCIWFVGLAEKINPLRALKVWVSRYFGFVGSAEENQSASGDVCVFANRRKISFELKQELTLKI